MTGSGLALASQDNDLLEDHPDHVILGDHQEILETEEEVLDDDDCCLENPPD